VASDRVVIIGYGRVGALVGDMLKRHDIPFVAIDEAVDIVAARRDEGVDIYWGSATRRELLLACGVAQARAVVVTVQNPRAAEEIVLLAHEARADMTIVARARDADHATRLYEAAPLTRYPKRSRRVCNSPRPCSSTLACRWASSSPRFTKSATNIASS